MSASETLPRGFARVTRRLIGPGEGSLAGRARRRRARWLLERFPDLRDMRVLDLGGELESWLELPVRPADLTLLNIPAAAEWERRRLDAGSGVDGVTLVSGDACDPPAELRGQRFDLVFSNSVIEHVGGRQRREAFAHSVHELGEHHWVQTPNRYFPLEPHWLFPGFQFLPPRAGATVARYWPLGNYARDPTPFARRLNRVLWTELVSPAEMGLLFPQSELLRERSAGLTKSLIAVR